MLIRGIMVKKQDVSFLSQDDTLKQALTRLEEKGYTTFPVLDGNKFSGIITRRKIFETFFKGNFSDREEFLNTMRVKDILIDELETVSYDALFDETMVKLMSSRYDFLPVVSEENGEFMGIVTRNNILKTFEKGMGLDKKSYKLSIIVNDFKGTLARLTSLIAENDANIVGMATFDAEVMNLKFVELKVDTGNINELRENLRKNGFKVWEG
jgi:acetoin utilization protein AcuB